MKPKIAVYWTGSCGGCDVSFLEVGEGIVDILSQVEIVFWPALVDQKRADLEALPRGSIDLALINGTLRTEENLEMVQLLRERSKALVAYGACAHLGGIPSLGNLFSRDELLAVCRDGLGSAPPPDGTEEDAPSDLLPQALPLSAVVEVEYVVPGCPPPAALIARFFDAFLSGEMPEPGHVFAGEKALCEECPLERREDRKIERIVRPHEAAPEPGKCLLEQGFICLGPVTRSGCGAVCPKAGMPCTGCLGPTPKAGDQGMAMISALASLVRAGEEGEAAFQKEDEILDGLVDPIGTLYKFGLPSAFSLSPLRERAGVRGEKKGSG